MKKKIKVNIKSQIPVYKQLIQSVENTINTEGYQEGDFLPSMNVLANELAISKETVKKAYSILRQNGIIESAHGKGFYILNQHNKKSRILLLFDKISSYKQVLYSSFAKELEGISEITIKLHNQDVDLLDYFIDANLDNFDYYIITPHFPLQSHIQKKVIKAIKRIPNRKLILLDNHIKGLTGNYSSVYQDFENDIVDGLQQAADRLKKYNKLNVLSMPGSLYASQIEKGITKYCTENKINFEICKHNNIDHIKKNEVYLILNSQLDRELIELVRIAKAKGCKIGEDIGIISYNESPINEIILDGLTVFSTDFEKMGKLAAQIILDKTNKKIKCDFKLVARNTF